MASAPCNEGKGIYRIPNGKSLRALSVCLLKLRVGEISHPFICMSQRSAYSVESCPKYLPVYSNHLLFDCCVLEVSRIHPKGTALEASPQQDRI